MKLSMNGLFQTMIIVYDQSKRMYYLTREITRIARMSHEELHKKYQLTWEKCLYNRKKFFSTNHAEGFIDLVKAIGDIK